MNSTKNRVMYKKMLLYSKITNKLKEQPRKVTLMGRLPGPKITEQ